MSFFLARGVGACACLVRVYRISRAPDVPLARIVPDTIAFGLKRGVGAESLREFFGRLRLETHVGASPSALRGVMQALEQVILETAAAWEREGIEGGEVGPIVGAVDETFLQRMMLVFMDLVSGYLLAEEVAEDRTYTTKNARGAPPFRAGRKGRGPAGATAEPSGGVEAPAFRPGRTSTTPALVAQPTEVLAASARCRRGGAVQP